MKLMIDIDEAIYEEAKNNWNYLPLFHCEEIWKATADGIPIPDNATNGDIFNSVFSDLRDLQVIDGIQEKDVFIILETHVKDRSWKWIQKSPSERDWWNLPYEGAKTDEADN